MPIELVTTDGVFALDGGEWEVTNNIWLVGDDHEVVVIDAAHDHEPIVQALHGRKVAAIAWTHAHNDHINAIGELQPQLNAPVALHPADEELWNHVYPNRRWDEDIKDGELITVGGARLQILHTPGHTPGGVSIYDGEGNVFVGDTLFKGGPGATGRSFSNFPTIIQSIRTRLLTLPSETVVYPGHGATTTIGDEAPQLDEWIERGY